ncbi:MAG TPA: hypothetical protein VNE82_24985, partial [Candidatus Binataceae bacterium]|nr:hypothetical protein [Candidatus Binataceae bacterium]
MARELNLKVMFEAIDRMSPVLKRIGIGLDNANKAAAAAGRSMRSFAAVGATIGGAYYGASKITEHLKAAGDLAEPLAEAQTAFEQVAGAQNVLAASSAALTLTQKYGQAPRQDELAAITQGYRLYGNLKGAIDATTAATKLAVATHQPLADSFAMLTTFARNAGLSVGTAGDKLARFYQVAGAAAESKTDVRMLQRGLAAAMLQHIPIDQYLATVASLLKSEGTATGIGADVFMYFEPGKKPKARKRKKGEAESATTVDTVTRRASAEALHAMVAHAGDLSRNLAAMHRATGALDTLTQTGLADPALLAQRARISAAASEQARGEAYLKASVPLEAFNTKFAIFIAGLETAHPLVTEIAVGTGLYGAGVLMVGVKVAGAVIAFRTLASALNAASVSALNLASATGGEAAGAAEKAAAGDAGLVARLLKRGVRVVTVSAA